MTHFFRYDYTAALTRIKEKAEVESITIPDMPKEKGFITSDVQTVTGIFDDNNIDWIKERIDDAAIEIYTETSGYAEQVVTGTYTLESNPDTEIEGVGILYREIEEKKLPILENMLRNAVDAYVLMYWFSIYIHRTDLSEKYSGIYMSSLSKARSQLIQRTTRNYRAI